LFSDFRRRGFAASLVVKVVHEKVFPNKMVVFFSLSPEFGHVRFRVKRVYLRL